MYFSQKSSSGRKTIINQAEFRKARKVITEYNLLKFMWKEFGIKADELENYSQDWIDEMTIIANTEGQVEEQEMRRIEAQNNRHGTGGGPIQNLSMGGLRR